MNEEIDFDCEDTTPEEDLKALEAEVKEFAESLGNEGE